MPTARAKTRKRDIPALKPVGVTEDGTALILSRRAGAKTGSFRVVIDDALVEQLLAAEAQMKSLKTETPEPIAEIVAEEVAQPSPPPVVSKLTPREVQAMLRQGRTSASIARKAGVDITWVERFEMPIIWERAGMATRAQRATLARTRRGISGLPLGEAVRTNLKRKRVSIPEDQFAEAWDAVRTRKKTKSWVVRFTFQHRGRNRVAEWEFDPATDRLRPLNDLAGELGFVAQRRRR